MICRGHFAKGAVLQQCKIGKGGTVLLRACTTRAANVDACVAKNKLIIIGLKAKRLSFQQKVLIEGLKNICFQFSAAGQIDFYVERKGKRPSHLLEAALKDFLGSARICF